MRHEAGLWRLDKPFAIDHGLPDAEKLRVILEKEALHNYGEARQEPPVATRMHASAYPYTNSSTHSRTERHASAQTEGQMWSSGFASTARPGRYHMVLGGFVLAEVIQRRDPRRRTLGQIVREDICDPLDLDFMIGACRFDLRREALNRPPWP